MSAYGGEWNAVDDSGVRSKSGGYTPAALRLHLKDPWLTKALLNTPPDIDSGYTHHFDQREVRAEAHTGESC